jgi:hypothetical protein
MTKLKLGKSGLTLAELLIANVIAILAFVVLFYVSFSIQENIGITSGILGISEKGRVAVNYMSRDIREANSVISLRTIGGTTYSTSNDTLVLKVPSIDEISLNLKDPDVYFDYIVYTLDPANRERLIRAVDAYPNTHRQDVTETVIEYIDTLSFQSVKSGGASAEGLSNFSAGEITAIKTVIVKIITKTTVPGMDRTNEISTSVSLRNKEIGP